MYQLGGSWLQTDPSPNENEACPGVLNGGAGSTEFSA